MSEQYIKNSYSTYVRELVFRQVTLLKQLYWGHGRISLYTAKLDEFAKNWGKKRNAKDAKVIRKYAVVIVHAAKKNVPDNDETQNL